jgi:ribosomal protein S18 acetylase RimI-like enzyme
MAGADAALTFRPIVPEDEEFLYRVYASTRTDELAIVDWDDAQKESFLRMQFDAQHRYYQEQFKAAQFSVILSAGHAIGRLYVDRRDDEIRLVDIALLPEHRGAGIGSELMNRLLEEAAEVGKKVRIHVERFNPALSLYERLGFTRVEDQDVYFLMEWVPPPARSAAGS